MINKMDKFYQIYHYFGHFIILLWFLLLNVYLFVTAPQIDEKNNVIQRLERQLNFQENELKVYKDAFDFQTDSINILNEKLNN